MEEDLSPKMYYMLTILKDDIGYANIYTSITELRKAFKGFSERYPVRIFELAPDEKNFNIVLAKVKGKLIACLGPKTEQLDKDFIRCSKREMDKEELAL